MLDGKATRLVLIATAPLLACVSAVSGTMFMRSLSRVTNALNFPDD